MPDYRSVLGLTDNPFGPRAFEGVGDRMLDGISAVPLRLDDEPGLLPLFVPGAGPFQERLEHFRNKLQSGGYLSGGEPFGTKSLIFRVVGPKGSGKSTLTNLLIGELKKSTREGEILLLKESADPSSLEQAIKRTGEAAAEHAGHGCCLVFDDVRLSIENQLHGLFESVRREMTVVMFEIIHHAEDIRRPHPSSRIYTEHLETSWLTPEHALSFLAARVELFRAQGISQHLAGDLATFPFDAEEIRNVVSHPNSPEALTLRTLNWLFNEAIDREVVQRQADPSIADLNVDEIRARRIRVEDIYGQILSETLRESA